MRILVLLLQIFSVFSQVPLSWAGSECLETARVEVPSEKGLVFRAIDRLQAEGWLPLKGKLITQDLDQNGKRDFAFFLKKEDKLRVYVIWDGDRIMEGQCRSDLLEPTALSEFKDDPCKLKFESFKKGKETGLLIRMSESFTYKYLCRKLSKSGSDRVWNNVGTPD